MSDYVYEDDYKPLLERVKAEFANKNSPLTRKFTALSCDHVHAAIMARKNFAPVLFNAFDLMSMVGSVKDYEQLTDIFTHAMLLGAILAIDNLSISVVIVEDAQNPEGQS